MTAMTKLQTGTLRAQNARTMPAELVQSEERRCAISALMRAGTITPESVISLRRLLLAETGINRQEAEALLALERAGFVTCPEWHEFLTEAIVEHMVWELRPSGVLNEEQAEWLVAQCDQARTFTAFSILVTVLNEAHRVPRWFVPAVRGRAASGWPGVAEARNAIAA